MTMDALLILRSIRQLFNRHTRDAAPARSTAQPVVRQPVPHIPVAAPVAAVQAPPVEPPQAPIRKMRTLEEVRADLARLRLSASERHARSYAWRDTNFAPTDFMEMANN
jgi:hypothetical protein